MKAMSFEASINVVLSLRRTRIRIAANILDETVEFLLKAMSFDALINVVLSSRRTRTLIAVHLPTKL